MGNSARTLEGAAEAVWQYNKAIVDAVYDLIPAVKPQIAMYEQFGVEGVKAFKKTVDYCKSKDLVVIGDVKRGRHRLHLRCLCGGTPGKGAGGEPDLRGI